MMVPSVKLMTACISLSIFTLFACQKEISSDLNYPALTSNAANKNSTKKEGKILFISNRDGNDEVYAMNEDGSNLVRLTFNTVPDGRATWSANEQHIAFSSGTTGDRDIFVMNANGSEITRMTNNAAFDQMPTWSPDGTRIAFMSA
jgi:Tol biopolymer transport system component